MANEQKPTKRTDKMARDQVYKIFYEDLGGRALAVVDGPNGSELRFIAMLGGLVIVQIFSEGNGWTYYPEGQCHMVTDIAADVKKHLAKPETATDGAPGNFRVFNDSGELMATTVYAEDAALLVGNGVGQQVKCNGKLVWNEGSEETEAAESFDQAAAVMNGRAGLKPKGFNPEVGTRD